MEEGQVKAAEVFWRDAHYEFEVKNLADLRDDYVVRTVGYIVDESPRFLTLAQEVLPGDDGWRGVTRIPVENVLSRK